MTRVGGRALLTCAVVALALALAACGDDEKSGPAVGSRTLTVYSSLPLYGPSRRQSEDMTLAMKLALNDAGGRIGALTVNYVSLNSAEKEEDGWTESKVLDNARVAVRDPNAIAYLGDLDSAATALSLPLLNQAGILQVSPASTYLGLTRLGTTRKGEPERFYPARRRTFGRVVPADDVQALALMSYMKEAGVRRLSMLHDRGLYGSGLAEQIVRAAPRAGIEVVDDAGIDGESDDFSGEARDVALSGADAFLYGGNTASGAARVYDAVATAAPRMLLFAGDGVAETSFTSKLTPAAGRRIRIAGPGIPARLLPASARRFERTFRRRFGRSPEPYAIYAYEAMAVALRAIRGAGDRGNQRPDVVRAYYAIRNRRSVLGTYSVRRSGDTSLRAYSGSRVRDGRLVFDRNLDTGG